MANVEIDIVGDMQIPQQKQKSSTGFEFLQIPQLPLNNIGYPQAHEWIEHRKANIRSWSLFLNTRLHHHCCCSLLLYLLALVIKFHSVMLNRNL